MESAEFIEAIKRHVRDAAIEDTITVLKRPPGRRVPPQVQERSDWYNRLQADDLAQVNGVISTAVHAAVFGLLAVIDGVRGIEDGDTDGRFELSYVGNRRVLLNDPNGIDLHDLFNAED